jgi:carbamoyltransferase
VPGIIHVDGTCRVQTVSSGFLFELLTKFYELTECPMLLNTSFNLAGAPLVQTKKEAIDVLNKSYLDAVYFVDQNLLLNKEKR